MRLLKTYRIRRGLLQQGLADKCKHVSKQTVSNMESGVKRPRRGTLIEISNVLNMNSTDRRRVFKHFNYKDEDNQYSESADVVHPVGEVEQALG